MMEPQKPFACSILNCGMAFTNEDHLHVHTKKHDMVLQLGAEQKSTFVADQTPTPTRFIRNCEEVGLFQELQIVNPFEEGFKRAMETKTGILCLDGSVSGSTEELHTPQMMFLNLSDADSTLYTTTNNHRNITISRSSSDESGAIKEYETTTISKLRNEVTTISRVIEKHDFQDKINNGDDITKKHTNNTPSKDVTNETVSYTDNIIHIHSNIAIETVNSIDNVKNNSQYAEPDIKDSIVKDVMFNETNKLIVTEALPPIMSQKSIDYVVDSLNAEHLSQTHSVNVDNDKEQPVLTMIKTNIDSVSKNNNKLMKRGVVKLNEVIKANDESNSAKNDSTDDYEVIIKLPNKKFIRMKAVEELNEKDHKPVVDKTKAELRKALINKSGKMVSKIEPAVVQNLNFDNAQIVPNVLAKGGTLYPVTIVNPVTQILIANTAQKVPIKLENFRTQPSGYRKSVKRNPKFEAVGDSAKANRNVDVANGNSVELDKTTDVKLNELSKVAHSTVYEEKSTFAKHSLEVRSAASRRYRERLKRSIAAQKEETLVLRTTNQRLAAENSRLKEWILKHASRCNDADFNCLRDLMDVNDRKRI